NEWRKEYYYLKRSLYNQNKAQNILNVDMAALFIFLNRTCFNGLYRVNSKGQFNVPIGAYKNPSICSVENLRRASLGLQNVQIVCADYLLSDEFVDKHTFVYFDPPYRPLNLSSSFTSYTKNDFTDSDQTELAAYIKKLANRGAFILASNSDPKNSDPEDNFFDHLYSGLTIKRVPASRNINSNANSRGEISELLISNMG
ncbi:MAG TPA: Dam family site-specific DNA-(adenine-N6)-methyltransferase, partial [Chloroflexi bacterium]|nr:Dam family site-specific DNA-(adenine-N6)-methyltransferase [Chloroflexota bacterium]